VTLGSFANIDMGQLLIAGILPGLVMSVMCFVEAYCNIFAHEVPAMMWQHAQKLL
jgi:TRAP-type C4-dicarboxylate transport system permease large subunit